MAAVASALGLGSVWAAWASIRGKRIDKAGDADRARVEYTDKRLEMLFRTYDAVQKRQDEELDECRRDRAELHEKVEQLQAHLQIIPTVRVRDQIMTSWITRDGGRLPDMPEVKWP